MKETNKIVLELEVTEGDYEEAWNYIAAMMFKSVDITPDKPFSVIPSKIYVRGYDKGSILKDIKKEIDAKLDEMISRG